jgi:hypothetical protein
VGGDEFNDAVEAAFQKLMRPGSPSEHGWLPWNNCKYEAYQLLQEAGMPVNFFSVMFTFMHPAVYLNLGI